MKKGLLACLSIAMLTFGACNDDDKNTNPTTPSAFTELSGDLSTQTLTADKKYMLKGFVYVPSGNTLTIEPGTVIMGDKASKGTLVVSRGGKIEAKGTPDKPIIFTSGLAAAARSQGDWGGVILLGKAPINPAGDEAKIEGGLTPTNNGDEKKYIWYGGNDANDNSGTLTYVRIEFAGIAFSPDNEINGLTMGGVGAGTTINHVQVYRSGDDAFEWFGGTVNCDHLIATYTWDDDFDTDFGYSGKVQFGLAHRYKGVADQSGSNGFESDNDANGSTNDPQTKAMFSNMTIVGPIVGANASINPSFQNGAQIRRNSSQSIYNSIIIGFPIGLYIDDSKGTATSGNIATGGLNFRNNIIAGCPTPFKNTASWTGAATWFDNSGTELLDSTQYVLLADAYKFAPSVGTPAGRPSYLVKSNSPAATGANFTGLTGFTPVGYRGAFGESDDWTQGWTTYDAENNAY